MNFIKAFSIYSLSSIVTASIPFFLLPLLTAYLSPEEYGTLSIVQTIILFLIPLVVAEIDTATTIEYFKCDRAQFASFVSSSLVIPLGGFVLAESVMVLAAAPFADLFGLPIRVLLILPLAALLNAVPRVLLAIYRAGEMPGRFAVLQVMMSGTNVGLSVLAVVALEMGWKGRLGGIIASTAIATVFGLVALRRIGMMTRNLSKDRILANLKLGTPLIPHAMAGLLMGMSDRFIISKFGGLGDLGIYAVGVQMAGLLGVFTGGLNQVWMPKLFSQLPKADHAAKVRIVKQTYLLFLAIVVAYFGMLGCLKVVLPWVVAAKYQGAGAYVVLLGLGNLFNGLYFLITNYIFFVEKTQYLSVLTLGSAALSIGLNLVLVPRYGAMGAAMSAPITWGLFFVGAWIISARLYSMPWFSAISFRSARS